MSEGLVPPLRLRGRAFCLIKLLLTAMLEKCLLMFALLGGKFAFMTMLRHLVEMAFMIVANNIVTVREVMLEGAIL